MKKLKKRKVIMVKAAISLAEILQKKADLHTEGNLSAWLRLAGTCYEPNKRQKEHLRVKH